MRADETDDMQPADEPSGPISSGPWGPVERFSAKQRVGVHREVERLLDELAPQRPPPRAGLPEVAVKLHRAPGRCVMQAASGAVSVSWFPGQAAEETLGELQVIEWRGVVSLPGSARRADGGAAVVAMSLFRPVELGAGDWVWQTVDGSRRLTTPELAEQCRRMLHLPEDAEPAGHAG